MDMYMYHSHSTFKDKLIQDKYLQSLFTGRPVLMFLGRRGGGGGEGG